MKENTTKLTPLTSLKIPDEEGSALVRLCPQCGKRIPMDVQICSDCQQKKSKKTSNTSLHIMAGLLILLCILILLFTILMKQQITKFESVQRQGTSVPVLLVGNNE